MKQWSLSTHYTFLPKWVFFVVLHQLQFTFTTPCSVCACPCASRSSDVRQLPACNRCCQIPLILLLLMTNGAIVSTGSRINSNSTG